MNMLLQLKFLTIILAYSCGLPPLPPLPPLGCTRMEPVCVCSDSGHCYWQFVCVRGY